MVNSMKQTGRPFVAPRGPNPKMVVRRYFWQFWLKKLPSSVQPILAAMPLTSTMTDYHSVAEAHYFKPTIAKVSLTPHSMPYTISDALAVELQALRLEVRELCNEVRVPRSCPKHQQQPI